MGENAGAAGIAAVLAVVGFVLVVAGIRGTYTGVWQALIRANPQGKSAPGGNYPPDTTGGGGAAAGGGGSRGVF